MQESFSNAASRHLNDAEILLKEQRWDNAVYLAGYVVECAFKSLLQQYFKNDKATVKQFNHDIIELEGKAIERLRLLYPILDRQLPALRISGTVLARYHPERRYAQSKLWTEDEAKLAIQQAREIYQKTITKLVLDGLISSKDI